jgi:hypothetical protein
MKKLLLAILFFALGVHGLQAQNSNIDIEQVRPSGEQGDTFSDEDLLDHYSGLTDITNLQQRAADANHLPT